MTRKVMKVVNSATPMACSARITNIGSASAASSQSRRLISAMARNSDSETVPAKDSASPSISCSFASASPLRSTAPTNSVHTNVGSVNVGFSVRREMRRTQRNAGRDQHDRHRESLRRERARRLRRRRASALRSVPTPSGAPRAFSRSISRCATGPADEAAHHQAEGRRSERDAGRRGETEVLGETSGPRPRRCRDRPTS